MKTSETSEQKATSGFYADRLIDILFIICILKYYLTQFLKEKTNSLPFYNVMKIIREKGLQFKLILPLHR